MSHRASLLNRRPVPARGLSCGIVPGGGRPIRVLVLTAPVGEGHLAAARVLAEDLVRRSPSAEVTVRDVLAEFPAPLRWFLNDAYRWQLNAAPWLFGLLFGTLRRSRAAAVARAGGALAGRLALGAATRPPRLSRRRRLDVAPATLILGSLRLRGKVLVPACATITDFAGLELWADKGVDLHLVMHESLVPGVERIAGLGSAHPVSPLVAPEFQAPRASVEARRALGLPSEGTVVVVSGGGWGVGDLAGAVTTSLELEATVVCLAGRDPTTRMRLETAFAGEPRVRVLGFTDSMSDLLAAADVLVHSTGGVTCLEALARDCPVVAYGAPPGHAPLLAREMASLGLVVHARSATELRAALLAAGGTSKVTLSRGVDAASLVLAAMPRVAVRPRARFARTMASTAAATALLFALLASDATYPVVAEALALPESTTIVPADDSVALVVEGKRRELLALAAVARTNHLHASVAASEPLSGKDVATLRTDGLDPMPELSSHGVRSWFHAHGQLETPARPVPPARHVPVPRAARGVHDHGLPAGAAPRRRADPGRVQPDSPRLRSRRGALGRGDPGHAGRRARRRPGSSAGGGPDARALRARRLLGPAAPGAGTLDVKALRPFAVAAGGALAAHWSPAVAVVLPSAAAVFGIPTTVAGGGVLLTFDDGPHPDGTPAILSELDRVGASAVFFVSGEQVERYPELVREIAAAGHELGLHGYRHQTRRQWSRGLLAADTRRALRPYPTAAGVEPRLYRPPHGVFSLAGVRLIRELGLEPLLWSKWGRDWERGPPSRRSPPTPLRASRPATSYCSTTPITTPRPGAGGRPPPLSGRSPTGSPPRDSRRPPYDRTTQGRPETRTPSLASSPPPSGRAPAAHAVEPPWR